MSSSSAPPSGKSILKSPSSTSLGFFANARKQKHNYIQFFAVSALFFLSIRSLGQKYRLHNLQEDTEALRQEQSLLENRMNHIKQSLLAEAAANSDAAFSNTLRLLFAEDKI